LSGGPRRETEGKRRSRSLPIILLHRFTTGLEFKESEISVVVIFIDFQQRIHHEVGDQDARKQNIVIDEAPTMKKNGASYRSFQLYVSSSSLSVSDLKD